MSCRIASVTSYLSENEAKNLQNGDIHLAQIPDFEKGYLENHLAHWGQWWLIFFAFLTLFHLSLTFFSTGVFLAMEKHRMKRLLNWLETRILFIQQKTAEKVGLYTNNTLKITVLKSWTIITLEKEMGKSFIVIRKW